MSLKTAPGTLAVIELEDDAPDVLFERLPGASAPLWPDVRSAFMYILQEYDFGASSVVAPRRPEPRIRAWSRLARSLLPSPWDAQRMRKKRPMLFLVSGETTYMHDGRLRNWLVSDFVDQIPQWSAIAQWSEIGSMKPAFPLTRSLDPMATRAAGYARLAKRRVNTTQVQRLVREFAARLDSRITGEQVDGIVASATYSASVTPHLETQFARLLERVDPRVVLMDGASYGGRAGLVMIMKERGILVAEPQHGWIGPTHGAYNFGSAMSTRELRVTLPDQLLTFGEYWSEGIRHPARSIAIGKPHLERMSALAPALHDRPREVLLVSSVADPDELSAFGRALRAALPSEWTLRFRPHPSERAAVESRYAVLLSDSGVVLDTNSDVYDSLAAARGVVGVASTVLFEALAMGCRVFVKESPFGEYYTDGVFGPAIKGSSDLEKIARVLLGEEACEDGRSPDEIWKPGAVENFSRWVRSSMETSAGSGVAKGPQTRR